jgi:D-serine deaminase-like pyridoxal phosphate-dependent protein
MALLKRIRPDSAVKSAQRNSTPLQVVSALQIVLDLDVHHDRTGLLNLADASQLHAIAEARGDIAGRRVGAQVVGRNAGEQEEDQETAGQDHEHERRSDRQQSIGHALA